MWNILYTNSLVYLPLLHVTMYDVTFLLLMLYFFMKISYQNYNLAVIHLE